MNKLSSNAKDVSFEKQDKTVLLSDISPLRSFGVFIFNKEREMLLHQRAAYKRHAPMLWENACSSRTRFGEDPKIAARRRLREEMGIDCDLQEVFVFSYKPLNSSVNYEHGHVFIGFSDAKPLPNPIEVMNVKWVHVDKLLGEIHKNSAAYAPWFTAAIEGVVLYAKNIFRAGNFHGLSDEKK